jgi:hypothetical protein
MFGLAVPFEWMMKLDPVVNGDWIPLLRGCMPGYADSGGKIRRFSPV